MSKGAGSHVLLRALSQEEEPEKPCKKDGYRRLRHRAGRVLVTGSDFLRACHDFAAKYSSAQKGENR